MKFLSIFLVTILTLCVFWGALVIGGPSLIKAGVSYYFNDQVVLYNVKVSPRFQISVGKVDFALKDHRGLSGSSRGVSLDWSFLEMQPSIDVRMGLTNILDFGLVESGTASLEFKRLLSLDNLLLEVKLEKFSGREKITSSAINVTGEISDNFSVVSKILFGFTDMRETYLGLHIPYLNGRIDNLNTGRIFSKQKNILELSASSLRGLEYEFSFENFNSTLQNDFGTISLFAETGNLDFPEIDLKVKQAKVQATHELGQVNPVNPVKLTFNDVRLDYPNLSLEAAEVTYSEGKKITNVLVDAKIAHAELKSKSQYLGKLDNVALSSDALFEENDVGFGVKTSVDIASSNDLDLSVKLQSNLNVIGPKKPRNCFMEKCIFNGINFNYSAQLGAAYLNGKSYCSGLTCSSEASSHALSTNNTMLLINNLKEMKIFNPMLLAVFYSQMRAGNKVGHGHQLNF